MDSSHDRRAGLVHLAIVWAVWGSTFLAIRVAVRGDDGFPPFALSAIRVLLSGSLLLVVARVRGVLVLPPRRAVGELAASGVLLWGVGHAALLFGAQRAPSGTAAILFATSPLFTLVLAILSGRRRGNVLLVGSVALGFVGVAVLMLPTFLERGESAVAPSDTPTSSLALLIAAPVAWALGTLAQSRRVMEISAITSAALQQLSAGIVCALASLVAGEHLPNVSTDAWLAVAYLVVPGSIPAFTSYVRALQLLPTNVVMSFAYVNPIVAVFLGWWLLDEALSVATVAAIVLVALGIVGVLRAEGNTG